MKTKSFKIIFFIIAGILGVFLAIFLRRIEYKSQKPITDYFFSIGNILVGSIFFALAFTQKFKGKAKFNTKLICLGSIVIVCGLIMIMLQVA
jgi:hypothetical protein